MDLDPCPDRAPAIAPKAKGISVLSQLSLLCSWMHSVVTQCEGEERTLGWGQDLGSGVSSGTVSCMMTNLRPSWVLGSLPGGTEPGDLGIHPAVTWFSCKSTSMESKKNSHTPLTLKKKKTHYKDICTVKGKPCNQLWNAAVWDKEGNFKLKRKVAKIVQTLLLICVCVCVSIFTFLVYYTCLNSLRVSCKYHVPFPLNISMCIS